MSFYSHLSFEEREEILSLRSNGHSQQFIARHLGRNRSTISRELSRGRLRSGGYSTQLSHDRYMQKHQRLAQLEKNEEAKHYVVARLYEGWSVDPISGWLKQNNEPCIVKAIAAFSFETIYRFIYRASQKGDKLWKYLVRHHHKRKKRCARASRDRIKERQSICERPQAVNDRSEFGHFEADLVICKKSRPLLVVHERKSRMTFIMRMANKSANETLHCMLSILEHLSPKACKSVTFDNDMTFAKHYELAQKLKLKTWFCDAYASWQKGGIENMNGRIRRWNPRKTDLDAVSDEDMDDIMITINTTPRKCLGFQTPLQAFMKQLGKDIKICFK